MADEILTKTCSKCKETKSLDDFYISQTSADKRKRQCKICWDSSTWARYATAEYVWRSGLWQKYGLTPEGYDELFERQGRVCAICKEPPSRHRLHVDHCHATGRVRGLLCSRCNTGLGLLKDDPKYLRTAIEYLESVEGEHRPTRWTNNLIIPQGDRRKRGIEHYPHFGKSGDKHPRALFTEEQVRELRRRYDNGEITSTALAKEQGVSKPTMQGITSRRNYRYITDEP